MTEPLSNQIPSNSNLAQSTKFSFTIPNLHFANYFCQRVSIPGVSTNSVAVDTPFSKTYRHGDTLEFDELDMTFLVDEDIRTWEETYTWLVTLTNPNRFKEYAPKFKEKYFDGMLTIKNNANNPIMRIKFTNCHPVALGKIDYDTTLSSETVLTSTLRFRYDQFSIERLI